jgi:hypothetical protein
MAPTNPGTPATVSKNITLLSQAVSLNFPYYQRGNIGLYPENVSNPNLIA